MKSKKISSKSAIKKWDSLMQSNYGTPSLALGRGKGIEVWDLDGVKYLDFLGGIATNLLGHSHPALIAAVSKQMKELSHVSNFYAHPVALELAGRLQEMVGDRSAKVFFCNSGAEANEAAIKIARLHRGRRIVAATGAFHGRTMGALSITGQSSKREPFKPLLPGVKHVKYGDIKALKRAVNSRTAMVILEPIMGEAGIIPAPNGYLKAASEICSSKGALLAIDAVQTGMGRCGQWFGYEDEGISPDVITIAKGIGGGLPLGAMITVGKASQLFKAGSHGSTFGGNPVAAAAAIAVIDEIKKKKYLALNVVKGALIRNLISPIIGVIEVRGKGLLIGICLENNKAKEISALLQSKGFLVNAANESVIRIAPAFIVSERQIMAFVSAFNSSCEELYRG